MDNATHTLLGLSLAKAGLERITPLATSTLLISSNLPDIDVVAGLGVGTFAYFKYHRGITHSLIGVLVLSLIFTLILTAFDRGVRLRFSRFIRPVLPTRIFLLCCIGTLGHILMDAGNSYGARPLLPFSDRWFYGDLLFVVDPWIWLILGSTTVWVTTTDSFRSLVWLAIGTAAALVAWMAMRQPGFGSNSVPNLPRFIWFGGLFIVLLGGLLKWGKAGSKLARWSLTALCLYCAAMWMLHQSALDNAVKSSPRADLKTFLVTPAPLLPTSWTAIAAGSEGVATRPISLLHDQPAIWVTTRAIDPVFLDAIRESERVRAFLKFGRIVAATVEDQDNGYTVTVRDLRFSLTMTVHLDQDLRVQSEQVHW